MKVAVLHIASFESVLALNERIIKAQQRNVIKVLNYPINQTII